MNQVAQFVAVDAVTWIVKEAAANARDAFLWHHPTDAGLTENIENHFAMPTGLLRVIVVVIKIAAVDGRDGTRGIQATVLFYTLFPSLWTPHFRPCCSHQS